MKISYFFRPKMEGVFSIETVFEQLFTALPSNLRISIFKCTQKWKRYHSFWKARNHQGEINHITGDIHTIALFLKGSNTILTVHDIGRYERNLKGIRKIVIKYLWLQWPLKKVAYITTISDYTKQKLIDTCNISPDKIVVIPNPCSTDFKFIPKAFDKTNPVVLQIGSSPIKNLNRLIEAVKGTDFKLLLLRKPTEELKQLLTSENICYEFRYNLTREEVLQCYYESDIVFFASEHEGFGVPILEGQQVGRPVITSNIAPMNDVAGKGAILVNPFDVKEIKKALQNLQNSPELRMKLVEKGTKNLERFSAKKIAESYVELYELLNKKIKNKRI
ncbi:glycosyltransferase family 4 protein [Wenyingzhuangia sp. IMCC45574]